VQVCYETKFLQHSLEVILLDLVDVVPGTPAIDTIDYYYHSGLIFFELKRYADAFKAWERVMVTPTKIINEVHIASFKKLILMAIVLGREDYHLPSKC
jgi:hypothetical protein